MCDCVRSHTHTLAFVDGFENKNLPAARPSSTTFASSSSFCRSSSPRGCFFLRYSGCGARPLTHTGAATRVRTHTVTLTHTHVQAQATKEGCSRAEKRAPPPKRNGCCSQKGRKRKTFRGSLPAVATLNPRARWHDTSVYLGSSSFDGVFFLLLLLPRNRSNHSKSSEKFSAKFLSHFYPTLALPAQSDSTHHRFLPVSPSRCEHFRDPRRTFRGQKVQ